MIDLVCLVADKNMEALVGAVLQRPESLGIRPIVPKLVVHPHRDPGCYKDSTRFVRMYRQEALHALVLLDRAWEGAPAKPTIELEADVDGDLRQLGPEWAKSIVIDPEIEVWLFRRTPRLDEELGWKERTPGLAEELAKAGLWPADAEKPADPKRAIEWALHRVSRPRSSSIYRKLGATLGMKTCTDSAFNRFRTTLRAWFPAA
ncbi:MAG TPA: hypothetical protein VFD82_15305 [Planctomycetota bacterium]|nr:hypothetical protein [Planctomycetota bacterium]